MNQHIKKQLTSPTGTEAAKSFVGNEIWVGAAAAAVVIGGAYLIYRLASRKQHVLKTAKTVEDAFNAGVKVGKRQEHDLREYLEERERTSPV